MERTANEAYEVIRVDERTWRIEDQDVRLFLLAGTERALLVDAGMHLTFAREIAEGLTDLPVSLINTHADRDHIAGNAHFASFYMHPAEEPVYRRSGMPGTIVPVTEGDVLDLGNRRLEVIELPGHTPGSIALLDEDARVLISGDPIQEHGRIYMFGDHRDMADYVRSLGHLQAFEGRFDEIWPSHADIPVGTGTIARLRDGAQDILDGRVAGRPTVMHGHDVVEYDLGFCSLLCDR